MSDLLFSDVLDKMRLYIDQFGQRQVEFDRYVVQLRKATNPEITNEQALEFAAQHLLTLPVFNALFGTWEAAERNAVSYALRPILRILDRNDFVPASDKLDAFCQSIKVEMLSVTAVDARQSVIARAYEAFFKTHFPKMVQALGVAYTPVEVVDFILQSIDDVMRKEFGKGLTDTNVELIDPFTGTGIFVARLLQSTLIKPKDLLRKYQSEIQANEIILLAYYIAQINIEQAYFDRVKEYIPFDNVKLTDTFANA